MWVKKINDCLYGYDTYKECNENVNGYIVILDNYRLFYIKKEDKQLIYDK